LKIVRRDPSDDKFIECAVALKAGHIITGDKALLSVKNYSGIEIVTAREFLSAHFPD
jgi:predicted nucleic acid-binding protein